MEKENKKKRISKQDLKSAFYIYKFMLPYKWYFILGMIMLVLGSLLFMLFPAVAGEMISTASGEPKYPITINQYGLIFVFIAIGMGIISYFRIILFAIVAENSMGAIRKELFKKLVSKDIAFFEKRRVGEITSRITADVEQIQSAFSVTLAEFFRQFITLFVGIGFLFYLSWRLSLVMLAVFPIVIIFAIFFGRYIKKISKERQDNLADTNIIVEEVFQGFAVVKAYVNELFESRVYNSSIDKLIKIGIRFAKAKGAFISFIFIFLFGAIFFILWQGALQIATGEMNGAELNTFIFYTIIIGGAIAGLGSQYTALASALGATQKVKELLESDQEIDIENIDSIQAMDFNSNIEFKNVNFHYPTRMDVQVLKNISFDAKKGKHIALVGSSGSGKSTIIKLLSNMYPINDGEILVDGVNIKDLDVKALRKAIGIVPQEVFLFGGSIEENILYGNPKATKEELLMATKQANAFDFIEKFPDKMETLVGERGVQLSGGQKQRVAIARAILKNPKILILDEATSSLDSESEKVVQDALEKLMKNRTTFVIAHRLSTIRNADNIFVLKDGEIIEQGNHTELEKLNGFYNSLLKLQFDV
jgi:ABC-type multidrug transport system fused ATPase/permease subunit